MEHDHVGETQMEQVAVLPRHKGYTCFCSFSEEALSASKQRSESTKKLWLMAALYFLFMVVEIIGGLKANSLAVQTDAAHMSMDVAACLISLLGVWAASWAATPDKSFGYHRVEIIGAFLSLELIWGVCGWLIYEAVDRISHDKGKVDGRLMFIISLVGLIINSAMVFWLGHDHSHHHHHHHDCPSKDHSHQGEDDEESSTLVGSSPLKAAAESHGNINIESIYLHVIGDMIQSVGVVVVAVVIWVKPELLIFDLVITIISSIFTIFMTRDMVVKVYRVLMETTPIEIDVDSLRSGIGSIKGVADVHDLHVWAITSGKNVLACHIVAEKGGDANDILVKIKDYCDRKHHIDHVTIQIEQPEPRSIEIV